MKSINNFIDILHIIKETYKKTLNTEIIEGRLLFRGQSSYNFKLIPGIFRESNKNFMNNEIDANIKFIRNVTKIDDVPLNNNVIRTIVLQHYGMPTRLLDWTSNMLVALYFACCCSPLEDGSLHVIFPDQNGIRYLNLLSLNTRNHDEKFIQLFNRGFIPSQKSITYEKGEFYKLQTDHIFNRQKIQSSLFTIHSDDSDIHDSTNILKFKIGKAHKQEILWELSMLGVNKYTVFGDVNFLSEYLIESYNFTNNNQ